VPLSMGGPKGPPMPSPGGGMIHFCLRRCKRYAGDVLINIIIFGKNC